MTEVTLEVYENEIDYMIEEARYLEAFAHLRHILEQYPRYVEAYYMLGKMMLETDLPQLAIDMFRRVLNADPEHLLARIGLGLAHERLDNTDAAIWNLERAFELDPGNEDLAQELARLYGRRSGVVPDHISLSRGGLARLYLRGNLYGRAANELREMVEEDDERVDLLTALAEALLRDDQIVQAADTCQRILDYFPYCLKANLLLGTLWLRSGQEEGEHYLRRAQEIDPRNELAQKIFGSSSPVEVKEVTIERLVYEPDALPVDSDAEWFKHLEAASVSAGISEAMPEMSDEEMRLVDITAGLESQIQIPDWLRELGPLAEEGEVPEWLEEEEVEAEELSSWLDTVAEAEEEGREIEEIPDWVEDLEPPEGAPGVVAEEEEEGIPDWMQQFQPSEEEEAEFEQTPEEEEMPDWMRGLGPAVEAAPPPVDEETLEEEEMPDWMRDLQPTAEAAPPVEEEAPEEEEVPDWMRELQPTAEAAPPEEEEVPEEEEIPDWMRELQPTAEAAPPVEEETLEEEEVPDWMRDLEAPQEEAGAPKRAVPTEAEGMFGWTSFAEAEAPTVEEEEVPAEMEAEEMPEWLHELEAQAAGLGTVEEAAPTAEEEAEEEEVEEVPEWLRELRPPEEPTAEAEAKAPSAPTAEGGMLSGDDALAWLESLAAGKEDELRAQAEAESRARVDEIMGRRREETVVEEVVEEKPLAEEPPEEEAPPPEGMPTPTAEGEMLSGDDALAWLQSLAAGKEDELRAQAEAESRARVDEIMGRKRAEPPVEEAPAIEEPPEAPPAEEVTPVEEAPPVEAAAPPAPTAEGEMLSGDDALAWLQSLTAGKEDELRAQAEAESRARVDEIMGRRREETVVEEVVEEKPLAEEPPEEEAPPPEGMPTPTAEGEMLSGDDALAWLQSLAAGKEDELRAQAEAESRARVDEIMGRKRAEPPVEEAPTIEAPQEAPPAEEVTPVEETPPVEAAAPPAPTAEGEMLSGDDALAWLQSLTAGKEDELRAQAEAESRARVDEIMGRKRAEPPVEEAPPVEEEAPVSAEMAPKEEERAKPIEEQGPFFGWSRFGADIAETEVTPEPAVREEEEEEEPISAFGFTRFGEEGIVAEVLPITDGREPPAAEEPEVEAEIQAEDQTEEVAAAFEVEAREETPPPPPEPTPEAEVEVEDIEAIAEEVKLPAAEDVRAVAEEFGAQAVEEEVVETKAERAPEAEAGAEEEIEEEEEEEAAAAQEVEEIERVEIPSATEVEAPITEEIAVEAEEEVAEAETKEEAPAPKAEAEVEGMSLDEQRAYVEEHDSDHKARLALARALWAAGEGEESISHYTQLIRSDELMEHVIDDLQEHSAEQPDNPRPLRALGDAYMKQGLLDKALKTYQEAMNRL